MALHHVRNWALSCSFWLKIYHVCSSSSHQTTFQQAGRIEGRSEKETCLFKDTSRKSSIPLPLKNHWSECSHTTTLRCKGGWETYSFIWVTTCQLKVGDFTAEGEGDTDMKATRVSVLPILFDMWIPQRMGVIPGPLKEAGNMDLAVIFVKSTALAST